MTQVFKNPLNENVCSVVNIKNTEEYDVYIGRPSKWGNPFKGNGRNKDIELYENYISKSKKLMNDLQELKGKTLGCFCKPKKCHGDVLVKLVNNKFF